MRCFSCAGTGMMAVTDDWSGYEQPCWFCSGSGTLTKEAEASLRLQEIVDCVARGAAERELEGRDIHLMAAENGCHPHEIYEGLVAHLAQRFHKQLARLGSEEPHLYDQVVEGLALLTKTT